MPPNNSIDLLEQPGHVFADALHASHDVSRPARPRLWTGGGLSRPESLKRTDEPDIPARPLDLPDRTSYNRG